MNARYSGGGETVFLNGNRTMCFTGSALAQYIHLYVKQIHEDSSLYITVHVYQHYIID